MNTNRAPPTPNVRLKRLKRLLARVAWLTKRIEQSTGDTSYNESERAALEWAIDELKQKYPDLEPTSKSDHDPQDPTTPHGQ